MPTTVKASRENYQEFLKYNAVSLLVLICLYLAGGIGVPYWAQSVKHHHGEVAASRITHRNEFWHMVNGDKPTNSTTWGQLAEALKPFVDNSIFARTAASNSSTGCARRRENPMTTNRLDALTEAEKDRLYNRVSEHFSGDHYGFEAPVLDCPACEEDWDLVTAAAAWFGLVPVIKGGEIDNAECGRTFEYVGDGWWHAIYDCGFECDFGNLLGPFVFNSEVLDARLPGQFHPHTPPTDKERIHVVRRYGACTINAQNPQHPGERVHHLDSLLRDICECECHAADAMTSNSAEIQLERVQRYVRLLNEGAYAPDVESVISDLRMLLYGSEIVVQVAAGVEEAI